MSVDMPEQHRAAAPAVERDAADWLRRTADVVVSSLLLILFLVPMLLIAVAVHLEDKGPAFFRQERVGLGGGRFTLFKFRTMFRGGDDRELRELIARELRGEDTVENGSSKLNNDSRVTRTGAFLRKTSLDELPQLLNVLRGDMTLVGPRPCLSWEAEMFPEEFEPRFSVPPGLTGMWQVSGRSTLGTLDMLRLDVRYVESRSLRSDADILLRTVPALLRSNGAR
jgi:lipopolysaccharide/colanic/teichoic acid biosynthesis glycosyltransferase